MLVWGSYQKAGRLMDNHQRRTSKAELIAELEASGAVITGSSFKCPWHDDQHASAGIYEKDGVWRFKCQTCGVGGDVFDMEAKRTGQPLAGVLKKYIPARPGSSNATKATKDPCKTFDDLEGVYGVLKTKHGGQLEGLHEYTNADGSPIQNVIRWRGDDGQKYIWPVVHTFAGYELRGAIERVLYRLSTLAQAKTIIVVEGELKTDILAGYGFAVTTSIGGSKVAGKTDWQPLAGRQIIIWPDHDIAGRGYAEDVRKILEGLGCQIKIIDPTTLDLREKEDAADYIEQLKNAGFDELKIKENLLQVFAKAKSTGPGQEVQKLLVDIGAGRYEPLETGFSTLDDIMQILPGSLNLVCGSPGSSKSLLMLQLAARWYENQIKTAVFELEKDRVFHLRRALAQRSGLAMLTNNRWAKNNAELAQTAAMENLEFMDNFGRAIYAMPEKIIYQKDVVEWVRQRADAGSRAIVIDPATKAERLSEPYKADGEFVQQLARIATLTRTVIFIVLHPAKTQIAMPDLAQIAGGAAYGRFADNAIWLEIHEPKQSRVKYCTGTTETQHDRTLWILKSRDGSGTGARIAFEFDSNNLTLRELERIERKPK